MDNNKNRPGTMIYFDIAPALEILSNEETGKLFKAILNFGITGETPDFDGPLGVAWALIRPRLERDCEQYKLRCLKSKYAAYCRLTRCNNPDSGLLSYDEWVKRLTEEPQ